MSNCRCSLTFTLGIHSYPSIHRAFHDFKSLPKFEAQRYIAFCRHWKFLSHNRRRHRLGCWCRSRMDFDQLLLSSPTRHVARRQAIRETSPKPQRLRTTNTWSRFPKQQTARLDGTMIRKLAVDPDSIPLDGLELGYRRV